VGEEGGGVGLLCIVYKELRAPLLLLSSCFVSIYYILLHKMAPKIALVYYSMYGHIRQMVCCNPVAVVVANANAIDSVP
jgi:hypothetical protein